MQSKISPMNPADFAPLASGHYLEGLLVEGDDVWFTDVVSGGVRRVGSEAVLLEERTMIGGLLLNQDGCLLVAGVGGIVWVDPERGGSGVLVEGFEGVNEMRPDGRGGMVFGTIDLPAILRGRRPGPSSIYRLGRDRALTQLRAGLAFANGLAVSADGSTLFFNESFAATRAFPVGADGMLGEPRLMAEKPDCDGLALDAEGNVWISGFASGELLCLAPDGREVRRVPLPGPACSNVRFGGSDMRDLYVTVVDPNSARALAEGRIPKPGSSTLFRTQSPVAGARIERTRFELRNY
jgi:sugar lactone lactonase YvrE